MCHTNTFYLRSKMQRCKKHLPKKCRSVKFKSKTYNKYLRKVYTLQKCTVIAIPKLFSHPKLSQRTMVDGKLVDGV